MTDPSHDPPPAESAPQVESSPRRRRWLRFGIRGLLVLVAAIAVPLGWWAGSAQTQRRAVAAIRAYDPEGMIQYRNGYLVPAGTTPGVAVGVDRTRFAWRPLVWLEDRLGRDYFHPVANIEIGASPLVDPSHRTEALAAVASLRGLTGLGLEMPVDDADFARLAHLASLDDLAISAPSPGFTDASMAEVGRLTRLKRLIIKDAAISDVGIEALSALENLDTLRIGLYVRDSSIRVSGRCGSTLGLLPKLTSLMLVSPALTGADLGFIAALPRVERLAVGGSFGDENLSVFARSTSLKWFTLLMTDIDGSGLRHLARLPRLETLWIDFSAMDDRAIPVLTQFHQVKEMALIETRLTPAGIALLRAGPPPIRVHAGPAAPFDLRRQHYTPTPVGPATPNPQ